MKTDDYLTRCPYYRCDRQKAVGCEGLCSGMLVYMSFGAGSSKRRYKNRYCRSKWTACPWAQTQNRRYDYQPPNECRSIPPRLR